MRASKDMATNYLIVIGIVFLVTCFVCAGITSDTVAGILALVLAPFRWFIHLFSLGMPGVWI